MDIQISLDWDEKEIEKRKQRVRDLWQFKKVDHIPIVIWAAYNPKGYSVQEMEKDKTKNLEYDLWSLKKSIELFPDDYIPFIKPEVGCVAMDTLFGCELYWPDNPEETVYIKSPVILDINDIEKVQAPNPLTDGQMPECIERVKYFVSETKGKIPITGIDLGGVLNCAHDIMDTNLFYTSMIDCPDKLHSLLAKISDAYIACYDLIIEAAGGLDKMTTIDFDVAWCPEGRKGYVSDDVCTNISPKHFEEFSKPYNERVYKRYGYGLMHNCGPHPCLNSYIDYPSGSIGGINISYHCSKSELAEIARALAGKAIAYFGMEEEHMNAEQVVKAYREIMEIFAPTTPAVVWYRMDCSKYSDDEILTTYYELRKISEEFARNMDWKNS